MKLAIIKELLILTFIVLANHGRATQDTLQELPDLPKHGDIDVDEAEKAARDAIEAAKRTKLEAEIAEKEALLAEEAANRAEHLPDKEDEKIAQDAAVNAEVAASNAHQSHNIVQEVFEKVVNAAKRVAVKIAGLISKAKAENNKTAHTLAKEAIRRAQAARKAAFKASLFARLYARKAAQEAAKAAREAARAAWKKNHPSGKNKLQKNKGNNGANKGKKLGHSFRKGGNGKANGRKGNKRTGKGHNKISTSMNGQCDDGKAMRCISCNSRPSLKECYLEYQLQECTQDQQCAAKLVSGDDGDVTWWSGCYKAAIGECNQENVVCTPKACEPSKCIQGRCYD